VGGSFGGLSQGRVGLGEFAVGLGSEKVVGGVLEVGKLATDDCKVHEWVEVPRWRMWERIRCGASMDRRGGGRIRRIRRRHGEGGWCRRGWVSVVKAFIKHLRPTLPNFLGEC
jgi:hypothetical protein